MLFIFEIQRYGNTVCKSAFADAPDVPNEPYIAHLYINDATRNYIQKFGTVFGDMW